MGIKKNTVVRGCLVPSLKNKPLDGRQDVPTLADIVNIENPYVNFIFPVAETGKWYKVISLRNKVMGDLEIPDGEIDKYELFGEGLTDEEKQKILFKDLAEQTYLKKDDAEKTYLTKKDAAENYQPKGNYQPQGDYATKDDLRNAIGGIEIPEEVHIGTSEPTDDSKLWVDTSVIPDGGGNGGGSNTPGGDGGNDDDNEGGSGDGGETKKYETLNLVVASSNNKTIMATVNVNGKDIEVSSDSSYSELFEYGTEYTITPFALDKYETPTPLTFVAGQELRTVTLTYVYAGPLITTIRIDQGIVDPDTMITRIFDEGGIEAIRANSHRYTGEVVDSVMKLKQIDDKDGTKYLDGTNARISAIGTDVWMKLPQFYYKCVEHATDIWDFSVAYGSKPDETYKEWDGKDLIGVYEATLDNLMLYSASGRTIDKENYGYVYRSYAKKRGENFSLIKWKHHCMMAMLFYTYYGTTDSQSICGTGYKTPQTTGSRDSLGMIDSEFIEGQNEIVNFWGLEAWWGYLREFIENMSFKEGKIIITEDDGSIRNPECIPYNGFVTKLLFGDNLDLLPTAHGGTNATGYCDMTDAPSSSSSKTYDFLRSVSAGDGKSGVLSFSSLETSQKSGAECARLAYRGEFEIIS